jgi:hypothetical protein
MNGMRLSAPRALAIFLSVCIAVYFIWAAWTDAPVPKLAWFGFAAMQFFNAALIWGGRGTRE